MTAAQIDENATAPEDADAPAETTAEDTDASAETTEEV